MRRGGRWKRVKKGGRCRGVKKKERWRGAEEGWKVVMIGVIMSNLQREKR